MTDQPQPGELEFDYQTLQDLLNGMVSRTRYWWAAEILEGLSLEDDEIEALLKMPTPYRQRATAHLIDVAEAIREGSRNLDTQLMRLTGELV